MAITTAKAQAVSTAVTRTARTAVRNTGPFWPKVAFRVPSNSDQETLGWLGDVPGMQEFLGDRIFKELRAMNYSIVNKEWEQSIGLKKTVIDDDRHALFTPAAGMMGQKAALHPDKLLTELINAGETTVCYDGQFFYDTDHVEGDSGTQSNLLTHAVVSTSAVTVEEFTDAFEAALIKMFSYKTDQGDLWVEPEMVGFEDSGLVIMVPPALLKVASKSMAILLGSGGAEHHVLRRAEVVGLSRMGAAFTGGSDVRFDLVYNGGMMRPFVFQDREALKFQTKGANDIEDKIIKLMSYARYNVGYGLWQYAVRTIFST